MPVTVTDFRRIALSFPEAIESAHQDHPDFRVGGKVFATLRYPEKGWGMVKLPPKEQVFFIEAAPHVFQPANGTWGLRGATIVRLRAANKTSLRRALAAGWRSVAPKTLVAQFDKASG
ncbi:MAG: MmcQ/YjbR family DNA-binding protein [Candidatus Acidiferrales bacterium]